MTELSDVVAVLREIGLLSHLDETVIQSVLRDAQQANVHPRQLLDRLPNLIFWFDYEFWWAPTVAAAYIELVNRLSQISRGHFQPTEVHITPDDPAHEFEDTEEFILSFEWAGKTYTQPLTYIGNMIDARFVDGANSALYASNSEAEYYWINCHDSTAIAIFLTPYQYFVLQKIVGPDLRPWKDGYDISIR